MRVFFDASVVIAALLSPTGGSNKLFKLISLGLIKGITSQNVIDEVLEEKHFHKIKRSKEEVKNFIANSNLIVRQQVTFREVEPYQNLIAQEDGHLITGAVLTKSRYLVTLDKKHLLTSEIKEKFLPLRIVSPKDLLEEMTAS